MSAGSPTGRAVGPARAGNPPVPPSPPRGNRPGCPRAGRSRVVRTYRSVSLTIQTCLTTVHHMTSRHAGEAGVGQLREGARARILDTAYDLFSQNGIGSVGIDRIIADAS